MAEDLNREELEGLLGAYALDAVEGDEARQVERLLEVDADARNEVTDFKEIAGWLVHPTEEAPDLWAGIQRSLDPTPATPHERAPVLMLWDRSKRQILAAAAVFVLVIVVAAALVNGSGPGSSSARAQVAAAALAAQRDADARTARLDSPDGVELARVVYLPGGRGYIVESDLPALRRGRTYQLWALVGNGPDQQAMSAAVLGRRVDVAAFQFAGPVDGFAITAEDSPGARQPGESPRLVGRLA